MDETWVERRVAAAQAAVKGTPNELPDAVANARRCLPASCSRA